MPAPSLFNKYKAIENSSFCHGLTVKEQINKVSGIQMIRVRYNVELLLFQVLSISGFQHATIRVSTRANFMSTLLFSMLPCRYRFASPFAHYVFWLSVFYFSRCYHYLIFY